MYVELFLAIAILLVGYAFFGHFEEKTALCRKLLKWTIYCGFAVLLSSDSRAMMVPDLGSRSPRGGDNLSHVVVQETWNRYFECRAEREVL